MDSGQQVGTALEAHENPISQLLHPRRRPALVRDRRLNAGRRDPRRSVPDIALLSQRALGTVRLKVAARDRARRDDTRGDGQRGGRFGKRLDRKNPKTAGCRNGKYCGRQAARYHGGDPGFHDTHRAAQ